AVNTLRLQAIADINIYRTYLHTPGAVNTIAQAIGFVIIAHFAWAAFFAANLVVRNSKCVLVVHHRLEACVRADVFTKLLAHKTGVHVSGANKQSHPKQGYKIQIEGEKVDHQLANRGEITNKGQRSNNTNRNPNKLLGTLAPQLLKTPRLGVQLDALVAITFTHKFGPDKHLGPHRLRAGKSAPDTPHQYRHGK